MRSKKKKPKTRKEPKKRIDYITLGVFNLSNLRSISINSKSRKPLCLAKCQLFTAKFTSSEFLSAQNTEQFFPDFSVTFLSKEVVYPASKIFYDATENLCFLIFEKSCRTTKIHLAGHRLKIPTLRSMSSIYVKCILMI